MYFSAPTQSFGYYRGSPFFMGTGQEAQGGSSIGAGQFSSGVGPVGGTQMALGSTFTAGQGTANGSSWSPTILYLFVFIIAEMFIFGIIARRV